MSTSQSFQTERFQTERFQTVCRGVTALGLVLWSSCTGISAGISPSSSPLPPGTRGTTLGQGSDCEYRVLGFIPVTPALNTQNALRRAKRDANADVLTDITVDQVSTYYILFSTNCVHVRGKGVAKSITNSF